MKKKILVIIPHASTKRPKEIKKQWLSSNQKHFLHAEMAETDRYSDLLYDFREIMHNKQLLFPISQVYINICRHPKNLEEICPLEIRGKKVYSRKIPISLRRQLVKKYAVPFYNHLSEFDGSAILVGHTMVRSHSSLEEKLNHQIVLLNVMKLKDGRSRKYAPDMFVSIYAEELKKRLPKMKIGINSVYINVYDYPCDRFGWDENGKGIPAITQETDEGLYMKDNKPDKKKLSILREIFAESLAAAVGRYCQRKSPARG